MFTEYNYNLIKIEDIQAIVPVTSTPRHVFKIYLKPNHVIEIEFRSPEAAQMFIEKQQVYVNNIGDMNE